MRPPERQIFAICRRQHAVIALPQLVDLGLSARAVQRRASRLGLHRIHRGVYSIVPAYLLTRHGRWMAAVLACGPDARLSHRSAAHLYDLRASGRDVIDVTLPRDCHLRIPGIRIHRTCYLPRSHCTTRAGIPCTSFERTLLDVAPSLTTEALKNVFDAAEDRRMDFSGLPNLILESKGRPGISKLRNVAAERGIGVDITANGLEERFLAICRECRLPEPRVNFWLDLEDGLPMVKLDFYWPELRAVVETDGAGSHGTVRSIERDYGRERRLARFGLSTTRFSRPEVFAQPGRVGDELVQFLARARAKRALVATSGLASP